MPFPYRDTLFTHKVPHLVIPEKIHTPPMDGILEILEGGKVKDPGNPGRRGVFCLGNSDRRGVLGFRKFR